MACALFSLYGYEQFSSTKALMLTKHHDLKAMVTFHYTKDVDGHGGYYKFLKNPHAEQDEWKASPILQEDITKLELEIYNICKKRAAKIKAAKIKEAVELDKEIEVLMIDMRLKTIEYLR
jgi:hypothetical protein